MGGLGWVGPFATVGFFGRNDLHTFYGMGLAGDLARHSAVARFGEFGWWSEKW